MATPPSSQSIISQRGNHTIPKRSAKVHGSITNDNSQRNKKKRHHPPPQMEEEAHYNNEEQKKQVPVVQIDATQHLGDSHQYKEKKRKVDGSDGTRY